MRRFILTGILALSLLLPVVVAGAKEKAGVVLALRGRGTIVRQEQTLKARARDAIFDIDEVITHRTSRMKLLFRDDSLLSLSEMSRLVVKEYLFSEEKNRSRAIYQLLEGKLRAIVGRSDLEIHTPTAVAAARGTGFFIWTGTSEKGPYTGIAVFEGKVEVRNIAEELGPAILVTAGSMTYVYQGMPPAEPVPVESGVLNSLTRQTHLRVIPQRSHRPQTLSFRPPPVKDIRIRMPRFKLISQAIRDPQVESLFSIVTINVRFP